MSSFNNTTGFKLTDDVLVSLGDQGVPQAVLTKLKALKDKKFGTKQSFSTALSEKLDKDEFEQYRHCILNRAPHINPSLTNIETDWTQLTAGEGWEYFIRVYSPAIINRLKRDRRTNSEAEIIAHDFISAKWEKDWLKNLKGPGCGTFRGFLKTCLRNFSIDRDRKLQTRTRKETPLLEDLQGNSQPIDLADDVDLDRDIYRCLLRGVWKRVYREYRGNFGAQQIGLILKHVPRKVPSEVYDELVELDGGEVDSKIKRNAWIERVAAIRNAFHTYNDQEFRKLVDLKGKNDQQIAALVQNEKDRCRTLLLLSGENPFAGCENELALEDSVSTVNGQE